MIYVQSLQVNDILLPVANLHFPMACIFIGSLLSEDGKIAVASSLIMTTFIISSIVFFIFGYFCHHYRQKRILPTPIENTTPI